MIRIGLVQMDSNDDLERNLSKAVKYVRQASEGGADLVAFPEFMNFLPFSRHNIHFETPDGRTTQLLQELAVRYGIVIHAGSILVDSGQDRPYNQSFLVDRDGQILGRYSKTHLVRSVTPSGEVYHEDEFYLPGNDIAVARVLGLSVGTAICYDFRFPELFRIMARSGAQVIFVPGNFSIHTGRTALEVMLRTRAIENQVFIISADQIGEKKKAVSFGHSMAIAPDGRIVALKKEGEGLLFCDIDPEEVHRQRARISLLESARYDLFDVYSGKIPQE